MMTNTYLPHVGGVARSVSTFAHELRRKGHGVLVVAPEFKGRTLPSRDERLIERVPALQNFNGSDFSVRLPLATAFSERIEAFQADIIHAHHPFLLGDTALRLASSKNVPIIFTHHTRYEDYTHYVPLDSPALRDVAIELPTHFANLCDGVVAPSESIARLLVARGVTTRIQVIPTGIDLRAFQRADPAAFRRRFDLPDDAFIVGHVGRLALEKNLGFLSVAVARFLSAERRARFAVVGSGPAVERVRRAFARAQLEDRLVLCGSLTGNALCQAYRAMNVFAFASRSETQGMVVAEAMAAGVPVVALNASGVREVVRDGYNGILLPSRSSTRDFAEALTRLSRSPRRLAAASQAALATAALFSKEATTERLVSFYQEVVKATRRDRRKYATPWAHLLHRLKVEWSLVSSRARALASLVQNESRAAGRSA